MSLSLQDVARILSATSSLIPSDNTAGIYIVAQEDDRLTEEQWVGSRLIDSAYIGSDVKSNTPAVYVAHGNQRSVFCVGEEDTLWLYSFDDEWDEISLSGNGELTVDPSSRLSGTTLDGDSIVFFEDTPGHLRAVRVHQDGNWESLPLDHVGLVPGSPHSAQAWNHTLYLTYIHQDGYMHRLTMDHENNSYPDVLLPGTRFSDRGVANLLSCSPDDHDTQVVVLTKCENLISVDREGQQTEVGKIADKVFVPKKGEENNSKFTATIKAAVNVATKGKD